MTKVAGFLVVLDKNIHPDQAEQTIEAVRQLRGVAGVRTMFDDAGTEIVGVHAIQQQTRDDIASRARVAGI